MGAVTPREEWQGSRSLWRLPRSLRRHGDEAVVQKGLESLKEGVPEGMGEIVKLIEWVESSYIISGTVR